MLTLEDASDGTTPYALPLSLVLGDLPPKTFRWAHLVCISIHLFISTYISKYSLSDITSQSYALRFFAHLIVISISIYISSLSCWATCRPKPSGDHISYVSLYVYYVSLYISVSLRIYIYLSTVSLSRVNPNRTSKYSLLCFPTHLISFIYISISIFSLVLDDLPPKTFRWAHLVCISIHIFISTYISKYSLSDITSQSYALRFSAHLIVISISIYISSLSCSAICRPKSSGDHIVCISIRLLCISIHICISTYIHISKHGLSLSG